MGRAKDIWEELAATDAYFAVATYDRYRSGAIDDDARHEFFESGRRHVEEVWNSFGERYGAVPRPVRALDYGCGVGRVLLPLAERCKTVTGVDISDVMLEQTRENAEKRGVSNVQLIGVDEFERGGGNYDFVHSYIVLQHIKPAIGYGIIRRLAESVENGGLGMIHVTYADVSPISKRIRSRVYRDMPGIHRTLNRLRGVSGQHIPMYEYDRDRVYGILEREHCVERFTRPTDHAFLGEMIFFRKTTDR